MIQLSRPPKPKLLPIYRQVLEEKNYDLQVELRMNASCSDQDDREIAHYVRGSINLKFWRSEDDEEGEIVDIGYISAWRTVSFWKDSITFWSDQIDQEVFEAFYWLLHQNYFDPEEVILHPTLLLERVIIKPEWRGQGFALPAVATFLDVLACRFVFLQPASPSSCELSKEQQKQASKRLKNYWQRLGFEGYDQQSNFMWTTEWDCPRWLRATAL